MTYLSVHCYYWRRFVSSALRCEVVVRSSQTDRHSSTASGVSTSRIFVSRLLTVSASRVRNSSVTTSATASSRSHRVANEISFALSGRLLLVSDSAVLTPHEDGQP